jgi:hypothetical protein
LKELIKGQLSMVPTKISLSKEQRIKMNMEDQATMIEEITVPSQRYYELNNAAKD